MIQTVGTIRIAVRADSRKTAEKALGILLAFLSLAQSQDGAPKWDGEWMSVSAYFGDVSKRGYWLSVCTAGERLAKDTSDEDRKFLEGLDFRMEYYFTDMGEYGMSKEHMANTHGAGTPLETMTSETLSPSWWESY